MRLGQAATYVADSADSVVGCTGGTSPYPQAWMMRATSTVAAYQARPRPGVARSASVTRTATAQQPHEIGRR